jgi:hypothetical protein
MDACCWPTWIPRRLNAGSSGGSPTACGKICHDEHGEAAPLGAADTGSNGVEVPGAPVTDATLFARWLANHLPADMVSEWISLIPALQGIANVERKYRRLEEASASQADLLDYLAELRFALMFRALGFEVEAEPLGKEKGPDFRVVRDGLSAMLECFRLRPAYGGPLVLDLSDPDPSPTVREYGNVGRDTQKAHEKIAQKFSQIEGSEMSLIGVWNDERELEELEVGIAVSNLRAGRIRVPPG